MKKVITELTNESVNITVVSNGEEHKIELPVRFVAPQISLQIAGMISSDPTLPRKNEKAE